MTLDTYANLQIGIKNWLHRSGVTGVVSAVDQVPDFITLGEARISAELRVRAMETQGSVDTVAGTATVALPTSYRQAKWLYIDASPKIQLEYMSGELIFKNYTGSSGGLPKVFCPEGDNWRLGPTPDGVYTVQYLYYKAPTPLSGSTTTNTLFPRYNYLYLYAALVEAYSFLEDDAQVKKCEAMYDRWLKIAHKEDLMDRHSGSTLRHRSDTGNP